MIVADLTAVCERLRARGDDPDDLRRLVRRLDGDAATARWMAGQALATGDSLVDTALTLGIRGLRMQKMKARVEDPS
ncbi:MAG TPA: hypothetical protein VI259_12760 [Gemmatimonadaceae bacterium]